MKSVALSSLARNQENNSSLKMWCEDVFERLRIKYDAQNIALFICSDNGLKLVSSQTQNEFCFYSVFRMAEEYSGYSVDWNALAVGFENGDVSYISELPLNATWRQNSTQWEHVVVPLVEGNEILGYMLLEAELIDNKKRFSAYCFRWIKLLAEKELKYKILLHQFNHVRLSSKKNELSLALDNHSLSAQLSYLKSLHEISLRFTKATSIHSLCRIAVELGKERLQIDRIAIFRCDMETYKMWGTWGTDKFGHIIDRSDVHQDIPHNAFMDDAFAKKNELIVKDNVPLYFGKEQVGIGWNVMMAMWDDDECIGWIAADNLIFKAPLDEPKKEAIKLLAASVCQQIIKLSKMEQADIRFDKLQHVRQQQIKDVEYLQARVDGLNAQNQWLGIHDSNTGLLNARYFELSLPSFITCARERNRNIAAFSISMDFYVEFQKAYGREASLRIIQTIAREITAVINPVGLNMCFTSKPGKLSLLLHCNDGVLLRDLAEKIVKTIYALHIENTASSFYQRVTLSVGLAPNCVSWLKIPSNVLRKAEKACLMADKLGKNRFCVD